MQTEELVAGGELNARVAKAMGWRRIRAEPWQCLNYSPEHNHARDHWAWIKPGDSDDTKWHGNKPPEYSTDISAAWQVVERMRAKHGGCAFKLWYGDSITPFTVTFISGNSEDRWEVTDDNLPRAICRAALAAVDH